MYNVKLNEFSEEQLDLYIQMVHEKVSDITNAWVIVNKFEPSEYKQHKEAVLQFQFDAITLLKVQLENAKQDIKEINKVNSN